MTESKLQQEIVMFFRNEFQRHRKGLIFSIPNESTFQNKKFKNTGVMNGVSDLIVILPNGTLIFVELKTETGKQSEKQKDFQKRVNDLGYEYLLIRNLEEFKLIIKSKL